jgi:uncharacterized protein (DUF488 family)
MLRAHHIELLVDVRTVPRSARNPQFNRESLPQSLAPAIAYRHMAALGGLRHPRKDSINTAWRNDSFRGYADYMQTAEFGRAIDELEAFAAGARTVVMCAEAVPWRCHRSMIADAFTARGHHVVHIMSAAKSNPHRLTPYAVTDGPRVWYPGVDSREPPP